MIYSIFSIFFFFLIGIFINLNHQTLNSWYIKNHKNFPNSHHIKDAFISIQNLNFKTKENPIYILGASNIYPIYEASKNNPNVIKMTSGSMGLFDYLRIIENIKFENSNIIMGIAPRRFSNFWVERSIYESYYLYGVAGKFPILSPNFQKIWKTRPSPFNVNGLSFLTIIKWSLYKPSAFYSYLFIDIKDNIFRNLIEKYKMKTTHPVSKEMINCKVSVNELCNINTLSKDKIIEFKNWFNVSKFQFDESINESFKTLQLIIDVAKKKNKNFNIIIMEAAVSEFEDNELLPYLKNYYLKLKEIKKKNPSVIFIQFDRLKYDNSQKYFSDTVHVNKLGQEYYQPYYLSYENYIK